jgi:hypothetical protein
MTATPTDFTPPAASVEQNNAKMSHSSATPAPTAPEFRFSLPELPPNHSHDEERHELTHRHAGPDIRHSELPDSRRTWVVGRVGAETEVADSDGPHETRDADMELPPGPRIRIESVFPVRPPDSVDQ